MWKQTTVARDVRSSWSSCAHVLFLILFYRAEEGIVDQLVCATDKYGAQFGK